MLESDVLALSEESYELYLSGLMSLAPYDAMTPSGFGAAANIRTCDQQDSSYGETMQDCRGFFLIAPIYGF